MMNQPPEGLLQKRFLPSGTPIVAAGTEDLLLPHGFERVEEISPHHHSWGDAF